MKGKAFFLVASIALAGCTPREVSPACDPSLPTMVFGAEEVRYYPEFQDAVRCSRQTGRPILLMFTGYAVTASASVSWAPLRDDDVKRLIDDRLILCALLVDDRRQLIPEDLIGFPDLKGNPTTVGQRNLMLEKEHFNAQEQPLYALLDSSMRPLAEPHGFVPRFEVDEFVNWLEKPLEQLP